MTRNNIDDKLIDCFEDSGLFVDFEVGGWYITLAPGRKKPSFKHSRELNWYEERATQFAQENPRHMRGARGTSTESGAQGRGAQDLKGLWGT